MSKTHLDVGFTDLAVAVRRRYLDDFFPRAMAVAAELRAGDGPERLRWTTGSWILTEALAAADRDQRRAIDAAIDAGDLCWHALPFTLHSEYCERSLVEHGLGLSAALDDRYGRRTRAAKVTDVPGHTRGLVSLLAAHGVELLHVGVNPAAAAPEVPLRFRWVDDPREATGPGNRTLSPREVGIDVMYQPGGYGAVQVVPGTATAVATGLTGDNLGPPATADVLGTWARLREEFPDAAVVAATFDDVADVMASVRDDLPVVTAEIGDTWIHGTASDPVKTAGFRALCRERVRWIAEDHTLVDDPAVRAASTELLLVAEHTWGLDQKSHWPDETHWGATDLAAVRGETATVRFESSWAEQRAYLDRFVDVLRDGGRADLADRAERAAAEARTVERPDPDGLLAVEPGSPVRLGGFEVGVGVDGSIVHLQAPSGRGFASDVSPIGRAAMQTFDAADFERWYATYNAGTEPEDEWWARWDNTKPGLADSAARSAWWAPTLRGLWRNGHGDALVARLGFAVRADDPVAVPAELWSTVRALDDTTLELSLSWFRLRAARWPVAWWWTFAPIIRDPDGWRMDKLGEPVSPLDVVPGGGSGLHAVESVVHPDGVELDLVDPALVAPGRPRLLEWDGAPIDSSGGWHVCCYANLWGTNFPMWIEGDGRVRVRLTVPAGECQGGA